MKGEVKFEAEVFDEKEPCVSDITKELQELYVSKTEERMTLLLTAGCVVVYMVLICLAEHHPVGSITHTFLRCMYWLCAGPVVIGITRCVQLDMRLGGDHVKAAIDASIVRTFEAYNERLEEYNARLLQSLKKFCKVHHLTLEVSDKRLCYYVTDDEGVVHKHKILLKKPLMVTV